MTVAPAINVLLVDDDEDDYLITRLHLQRIVSQNYTLHWVNTSDKVFEVFEQESNLPDIVLIDYRLGEGSGLDLLAQLGKDYPQVPVILLTGMDDPSVDLEAMSRGATDFLVKGQVNPSMLERSIRYAIEHKRVLNSLREVERARELFYATLAHDLKTPIRAERRALDMLLAGQFDAITPLQTSIVRELLKSNQFQAHMVDNLMAAYRQQASQEEPNWEQSDLHVMIRELVDDELRILIAEGNYQIVLALSDKVQPFFFDGFEVARVLRNLLHNALNYTPAGTQITLSTELTEGNRKVLCAVTDTGPGIPAEKLKTLFQPFSGHGRRFKQIGTGLGLYLSLQIIEIHEGRLWVETPPEGGCSFQFTLPYRLTLQSTTGVETPGVTSLS